jgi:uncharacterized protein YebE (UPF0316 family)
MFVMGGWKKIAPLLGFFEVLVWLLAIGQIMQNLDNWVCYVAYAGGFATGTYVGMAIENRIALGQYLLRIISPNIKELKTFLNRSKYKFTIVPGSNNENPVEIIFLVIKRRDLENVLDKIKNIEPEALYTVESIKMAKEESITDNTSNFNKNSIFRTLLMRWRLGR